MKHPQWQSSGRQITGVCHQRHLMDITWLCHMIPSGDDLTGVCHQRPSGDDVAVVCVTFWWWFDCDLCHLLAMTWLWFVSPSGGHLTVVCVTFWWSLDCGLCHLLVVTWLVCYLLVVTWLVCVTFWWSLDCGLCYRHVLDQPPVPSVHCGPRRGWWGRQRLHHCGSDAEGETQDEDGGKRQPHHRICHLRGQWCRLPLTTLTGSS